MLELKPRLTQADGPGCCTLMAEGVRLQLLAPLGAIKPSPKMLAVPGALPYTEEPETEATALLLLWKYPPDQPEGAEATAVPPTLMLDGLRVTKLEVVGQTEGIGAWLIVYAPAKFKAAQLLSAATLWLNGRRRRIGWK